jgi:hypothetical protein
MYALPMAEGVISYETLVAQFSMVLQTASLQARILASNSVTALLSGCPRSKVIGFCIEWSSKEQFNVMRLSILKSVESNVNFKLNFSYMFWLICLRNMKKI